MTDEESNALHAQANEKILRSAAAGEPSAMVAYALMEISRSLDFLYNDSLSLDVNLMHDNDRERPIKVQLTGAVAVDS